MFIHHAIHKIAILFSFLFFTGVLGYGKSVVLNSHKSLSAQMVYENTEYIIKNNLDLEGNTIVIPQGCSLRFEKSGRIANGCLYGNGTKIESVKNNIFREVELLGSFSSDVSRPEWFLGLDMLDAISRCLDRFQGILLDGNYDVESSLKIDKPFIITGKGHLIFKGGVANCLEINSSDVTVKGIGISVNDIESTIIQVKGNAEQPLHNIAISKCRLSGGKNSVIFDYCDNSSITTCTISDVDCTAIGLYSSHFILVRNNILSGINTFHRQTFSYGIIASYHYGDPKSTDVEISENQVSDNPYWEALDTHGGERITFSNNIVKNCWRGIAAVGDDHRNIMLCKDIIIVDNDISCSNEPRSNGIVFTGVGIDNLSESIHVIRNKVSYSVIALYSNHNDGVLISQNDLFATDEIWRDIGSRNVSFEQNKVELSSANASFYDKSVFYFKPTKTVANIKFGDIQNNIIVTRGFSLTKVYGNFSYLNSYYKETGNIIK